MKKYIVKTTQIKNKKKSQEITSIMNSEFIDYGLYKKVAYVELTIYVILALYLIQKFLLKYYIDDIKFNKAINQRNPSYVLKSAISDGSPTDAFNNIIISRVKMAFQSITGIFHSIFNSINSAFEKQLSSINAIRNIMKPMRDFVTEATKYFYKTIEKFSIAIMYTFHRLRQTFRRSLSGFNLIYHTLENSVNLTLSVLNSWELKTLFEFAGPLDFITNSFFKFLCFDENTLINNKKISDIHCGDILNNNYVTTTIECLNYEYLYKIKSDNQEIYVSGSHIIYDNENNKWCCVKDYNKAIKTDYKPQKLYSLSTSNHNIQIDNHTFSDYEEISNDKNSCLLINHYIMSDINKHLSFSDNLLNVQNVKNLDSGFVGQTLIRMNDNTLKNINSLEINDILFNNNRVIGIIKILAKDFIWYKCNNIISTDNCKYYIDNSCYPVNHKNLEISINDDFGYNIITELGYIMIHSNNNIDYKYLDFIQVSNIDVQDKITEIALTYMNRK